MQATVSVDQPHWICTLEEPCLPRRQAREFLGWALVKQKVQHDTHNRLWSREMVYRPSNTWTHIVPRTQEFDRHGAVYEYQHSSRQRFVTNVILLTHTPRTASLLCRNRKSEEKWRPSASYNLCDNCCYSVADFNFNLTIMHCSNKIIFHASRPHAVHSRAVWFLAVWLSGNMLVLINEVVLRRAQLVPGWRTVLGWVNHLSAEPAAQL